jgi:hypothetical protein
MVSVVKTKTNQIEIIVAPVSIAAFSWLTLLVRGVQLWMK